MLHCSLLGYKLLHSWELSPSSFSTYMKLGSPSDQLQLHPFLSHPLRMPAFRGEGAYMGHTREHDKMEPEFSFMPRGPFLYVASRAGAAGEEKQAAGHAGGGESQFSAWL